MLNLSSVFEIFVKAINKTIHSFIHSFDHEGRQDIAVLKVFRYFTPLKAICVTNYRQVG